MLCMSTKPNIINFRDFEKQGGTDIGLQFEMLDYPTLFS